MNGTKLLNDTWKGAGNGTATDGQVINGVMYFSASNVKKGQELWRTDGTPAGTFRVSDINPGPGDSDPYDRTAIGGTLYFGAKDGTHGFELFKYVP